MQAHIHSFIHSCNLSTSTQAQLHTMEWPVKICCCRNLHLQSQAIAKIAVFLYSYINCGWFKWQRNQTDDIFSFGQIADERTTSIAKRNRFQFEMDCSMVFKRFSIKSRATMNENWISNGWILVKWKRVVYKYTHKNSSYLQVVQNVSPEMLVTNNAAKRTYLLHSGYHNHWNCSFDLWGLIPPNQMNCF